MGDPKQLSFQLVTDWRDVDAANDPYYAPARREPWNTFAEKRLIYFLLDRQRWRCAMCGQHAGRFLRLQKDHIIALANGGTNTIDNQQMLCEPCHRLKTSQDIAMRQRLLG